MTNETPFTVPSTRRRILRSGALLGGATLLGSTAFAGAATAGHPQTLNVDVHPTINPKSKGRIPTTVRHDSDPTPAAVLADPNFTGFKLGPRGSTVDANGADAVRWQMKGNGDLKVHFDPKTAKIWFGQNDTLAVISATDVAWGVDEVRVV